MVFGGGSQAQAVHVAIEDIQWLGLRCRVTVDPATGGLKADIRTKANDAGTSVAEAKPVDSDGKVGLLVTDEDLEGTSVSVVLMDAHERVLVKKPTTVGGEDQ